MASHFNYATLVVLMKLFYYVGASHDAGGFRGIANIFLENTSLFTIEGNTISCVLASDTDIPVIFTWHWNSPAPAKDPEQIFEWNYDKKIGFDGRHTYESRLTWKSGISAADQKSVRGAIIYGKGSHGDDASTCHDVTLNIMWKPGMASVSRNPSGDILRDSTVIMTCSGDKGYPNGNVTWKINGTKMTDDVYKTDVITINKVQAEHNGDYTCYFTNGWRSGGESEIQTVEVKWQPEPCSLTVNPDDDYIILAMKLILTCTCPDKGNPMGEINWSFNGDEKTGTVYRYDVVTIDLIESQHAGDWECYYKNEIGFGTPSTKTIDVLCLPMIHLEFITYEFSSDSVDFNLHIRNPVAAITLEILICTNIDSDISCNKATAQIAESLNQNVELPKTSTSDVYNVTFTFADEHGIVTQHGIALKGAVKQNQIPTILAVLLGILFAAALVTIASLIYVFYWRHRIKGVTTQADTAVQYVNVGSVAHSGGITNTTTSQEYEDVATANAANSQTAENTNYMDLNQTDVQQTRNRPAELTVYQSLNGTQ